MRQCPVGCSGIRGERPHTLIDTKVSWLWPHEAILPRIGQGEIGAELEAHSCRHVCCTQQEKSRTSLNTSQNFTLFQTRFRQQRQE